METTLISKKTSQPRKVTHFELIFLVTKHVHITTIAYYRLVFHLYNAKHGEFYSITIQEHLRVHFTWCKEVNACSLMKSLERDARSREKATSTSTLNNEVVTVCKASRIALEKTELGTVVDTKIRVMSEWPTANGDRLQLRTLKHFKPPILRTTKRIGLNYQGFQMRTPR